MVYPNDDDIDISLALSRGSSPQKLHWQVEEYLQQENFSGDALSPSSVPPSPPPDQLDAISTPRLPSSPLPLFSGFTSKVVPFASPVGVDHVLESDHEHTPSIHRSEDFFFEDANLVLLSENNVAFGVHRGILRRLSTVFHHMLEVSDPEVPESEKYAGLPLVRLYDSTTVIEAFLQVIYDYRPIKHIQVPCKSLLLFCDKYSIDFIQRRILDFLLQTIPDTLHDWDHIDDLAEQFNEAIDIVATAFRLDTMKILLPTCLYIIMTCPSYDKDREQELYNLPPSLQLHYFYGFVKLSTYLLDFYHSKLRKRVTPPKGCNKAKCKEVWFGFIEKVKPYLFESDPDPFRRPRPLLHLQQLSDMAISDSEYTNYCHRCQTALPDIFASARREVWDSLPNLFKFGNSWTELRNTSGEPLWKGS